MELNKDYISIGNKIKEKNRHVEITFHPDDKASTFSSSLSKVAYTLVHTADKIVTYCQGNGEGIPAKPALTFYYHDCGYIHYLCLPKPDKNNPFWELVSCNLHTHNMLSKETKSRLYNLDYIAQIKIFISSGCPHCPHMVRAAILLAQTSRKITVSIIDIEKFPKLVNKFKISSVPFTVVNNEFFINEVVPVTKLAEIILTKGTEHYSKEALLSQVQSNNIDSATEFLLSQTQGADFFIAIWKKSTLSLRIGLMLIGEQILSENPKFFNNVVIKFISLLEVKDDALKGDTIDLLGQIGSTEAKEPIEKLLQDANPDIVEIAQEALESLD